MRKWTQCLSTRRHDTHDRANTQETLNLVIREHESSRCKNRKRLLYFQQVSQATTSARSRRRNPQSSKLQATQQLCACCWWQRSCQNTIPAGTVTWCGTICQTPACPQHSSSGSCTSKRTGGMLVPAPRNARGTKACILVQYMLENSPKHKSKPER